MEVGVGVHSAHGQQNGIHLGRESHISIMPPTKEHWVLNYSTIQIKHWIVLGTETRVAKPGDKNC